jgi:rubrerythrin
MALETTLQGMNDLQSSTTWWNRTKTNPVAFRAWLYDQYRGEVTAGGRIDAMRDAFTKPGTKAYRLLSVIAAQERNHARWVGELLRARGLEVRIMPRDARYWRKTVPEVTDLETGAAVGAHAEKMRLERIEAIAMDADAPSDVRDVFRRILPEERFHERAFRTLSTASAMARTSRAHELGRRAVGLVP